jgi:hypothetical protein
MLPLMYNNTYQIVQTKDEIAIDVEMVHDVRHIRIGGQHVPASMKLWMGDSVGHWDGDTLVIDTVAVREPNKYFGISAWLSDQAHYTERLRMVAPDRIEGEMTIVDPATLSREWVVKLNYKRADGFDRLIHDAYDNDRTGFDGDFYTIKPSSAEP